MAKQLYEYGVVDPNMLESKLRQAASGRILDRSNLTAGVEKENQLAYDAARQKLLSRYPSAQGGLASALDKKLRQTLQLGAMQRQADMTRFLRGIAMDEQAFGQGALGSYLGNLEEVGLSKYLAAKARKEARKSNKLKGWTDLASVAGQVSGMVAGGGM